MSPAGSFHILRNRFRLRENIFKTAILDNSTNQDPGSCPALKSDGQPVPTGII
jgi:hypothetical protein